MARIPQDFIDNLIDKVDIVDVISDYVALKRSGNKHLGLCPFHNEKTPSFTVDGDKQLFYCFGCHVGGNVVGFLEKKENLTFFETIEELAKRANVTVPLVNSDAPSISRETRTKILEANKAAARYYHNALFEPEGVEGLEYFTSRGLTNNIIRRFGLGYAPNSRDTLIKHLKEQGFEEEIIVSAGLAVKNDYGIHDFFRNRVMFPIISQTGEVIAFGGRVLDSSKPKYLNTNDTPVFNKRKNLFALNILKKNNKGRAIIGEGYMDVIALNMAGFDYGVASLGTAVTPEQIRLLKRYAQEIYICYDGDSAGISATHKVIDLMKAEGLKPKIIELPLGKDPDEFIKENGAEAFMHMMHTSRTSIEYLIDEIKQKCDMNSEDGRAEFAQKATKIVGAYAFDSIEAEMYLKRINSLSGFSLDSLYSSMGTMPEKKRQDSIEFQGVANRFLSATERALVALVIENPNLRQSAKQSIEEQYFSSQAYKKIFDFVCQTNEKLSVNALIQKFEGDEETQTALSAIGIESITFGDKNAFLKDCILKIKTDFMQMQRQELKTLLTNATSAEEKIQIATKMVAIDEKIKKLRSEF